MKDLKKSNDASKNCWTKAGMDLIDDEIEEYESGFCGKKKWRKKRQNNLSIFNLAQ